MCAALLQLDAVSRRILGRRMEQRHRVEQAIADQMLRVQEHVYKSPIQVISEPQEIQDLVQLLTSIQSKQSLLIVGIATDTQVGTSFEEWYIHLVLTDASNSTLPNAVPTIGRRIQVPLVTFGLLLADAFDAKVTGTALCFVADASSGLGSHVLARIAQECDAGMVWIFNMLSL